MTEKTKSKLHIPAVSIGMPVYNGEKWLARALDSLLAQTFTDFELIISDNASSDGTGEICRGYAEKDKRVSYYRNETNIGARGNFSRVVDLAQGRYFMWAAHDDWWAPEFVKRLVDELEAHPEAGLAMTAFSRHWEDGEYFDSTQFKPDDRFNPNNMTYLEMAVGIAAHKKASGRLYHIFIYGLYRTGLIKAAMEIPIPAVPAPDRVFMCQIALATKIRYVDEFLHMRTGRRKSDDTRNKEEDFIKIGDTDKLGFTRSWLAIEPYLWESKAIPDYRKCLISVVSDVFLQTYGSGLYLLDVQSTLVYKCDNSYDISEDMSAIELLLKSGKTAKAHELASHLALQYPDSADVLALLAGIKSNMKKKKVAKKILEDIIKDCPGHVRSLRNLAVILFEEGEHDKAVELAKSAVHANRDNTGSILELAKMLIFTGKANEAEGYLNHVLSLSPENEEAKKLLERVGEAT